VGGYEVMKQTAHFLKWDQSPIETILFLDTIST